MQCRLCKFWNSEIEVYPAIEGLGECDRALPFWVCADFDVYHDGDIERLRPEYGDRKAFVQDGSNYSATLLTLASFGCVEFTERQ